jgi:hypothetical protein
MEGVARESPRRDKRKLRSLLAGVKSDETTRSLDRILAQVWGLDAVPTPGMPLTVANPSSPIRGVLNYYLLSTLAAVRHKP